MNTGNKEGEAQGFHFDGSLPPFMPQGPFNPAMDMGNQINGMNMGDGKVGNNSMNVQAHLNSNNQSANSMYNHHDPQMFHGMYSNPDPDYGKHMQGGEQLVMPGLNMVPNGNENQHQMYNDHHEMMMMSFFPQHFMNPISRDYLNHQPEPYQMQKLSVQAPADEGKEKKQLQKRNDENAAGNKGDEGQDPASKVAMSSQAPVQQPGPMVAKQKPQDGSQQEKKLNEEDFSNYVAELSKNVEEKFQRLPGLESEFQMWIGAVVEAMNSLEDFYKQFCKSIKELMNKKGSQQAMQNLEKIKNTYSRFIQEKLQFLEELSKKQRSQHLSKCQFCSYYMPHPQPPVNPVNKFYDFPFYPPAPYFYDIYQPSSGSGQGGGQKNFPFPQPGNGMMGGDFYYKNPKDDRGFFMDYQQQQQQQGPPKGANDFMYDQGFPGVSDDMFHHFQGASQMNKKTD